MHYNNCRVRWNHQRSVPGVVQLTFAACYVMGVWFLFRGVHKLKLYGEMRTMMSNNANMTKPAIMIILAMGCLYLPTVMDSFLGTLWGYGTDSVIAYPENTDPWIKVTRPLIMIIRAFGLIVLVRGWVMLAKLGSEGAQPGTIGKAIMHMLGGICAWNIVGFWNVIKNTVGIA